MAKTQETKDLENALDSRSREKREYGCEEVTIGFKKDAHGDEIVDYMTMDADSIFKCYEIKVSLADLKTENKKSFYGDYNYLVVSDALYAKSPVFDNYIPPYAGILAGADLVMKRPAKKKEISPETREMLKDSLLRSVYWKMENYKDARDLANYRSLQKDLTDKMEELQTVQRQNERELWTYQDYEHFYRLNHQDETFTLENGAKKQRQEAALRQKGEYTWIEKNGKYNCPQCGREALEDTENKALLTDYCPFCGADLRKAKQK